MIFDPLYFIILAPGLLLAGWAQMKVKSAYKHASKYRNHGNLSGAQAAAKILQVNGLNHVEIEQTRGFLGDHYDPRNKVLRLSPDVYSGRSLAAVGIAAHEAGHALQDAAGYGPLAIRNGLVPMAATGSRLSLVFILGGFFLMWMGAAFGHMVTLIGIGMYTAVVLFQLVNLPVEFNASARARQVLLSNGIIAQDEDRQVARVLNAAALTYVAATLTALLTLFYLLLRFGGRD